MDLSLEELIKKNKKNKVAGLKKKTAPGKKTPVVVKKGLQVAKKGSPKTGSLRGLDARTKIIQKNRYKIRDAREKIAENLRSTIKDARELISVKKPVQPKKVSIPRSRPPPPKSQPSRKSAIDSLMDDDDYDMPDLETLDLKPIRSYTRTVQNDMFRDVPPTMPKPPTFSISQAVSRLSPDPFDCYVVPTRRPVPLPPLRPERVERFHSSRPMSAHMDSYEPRKSILRSSQSDDHDDRFDNDRYFSSSDGVRSRLYNDSRDRSESAGIFAKLPVRGSSPPPAQVGHRIIISNLDASVTKNDVHELFEDIGPLVSAHLVRTGIAEVVYKNLGDAEEAVETYHNRQLDGKPMKCMLVRSSSKTSSYARL